MEGKQWLGVTVPPKTGWLRSQVISLRMAWYPQGKKHSRWVFEYQALDDFGAGINWFAKKFWRTVAKRLLPLVADVQSRFASTALSETYNGNAEMRRAFLDIHSHVADLLARSGELE
jgi:hypothetical protein